MNYVLLLVGFVLLIKGADFFVEGSSSVAKFFKIPSVIIGLTIVAFGTSAPELAVSISAALSGSNDIAVGNVIGSNIFNLMVVVGACAMVMPMQINKGILHGDYQFAFLVELVMLLLFAFDKHLSRWNGLVLLALFAYFLYMMVRNTMASRAAGDDAEDDIKVMNPLLSAVCIVGGMIAIVVGGDMVVDNASVIAASFGLSETLIGLTVVAFGTSLPELVTSIVAAGKGENGLALGNVIGSNIFNVLFVLAASALISPMQVDALSVFDGLFLLFSTVLVWKFAVKKYEINRKQGIIMVGLYLIYTVYIILR